MRGTRTPDHNLTHCGGPIWIDAFPPHVRGAVGLEGLDFRDGPGGVALPHAHFDGGNRIRKRHLQPVHADVSHRRAPRIGTVADHGHIGRTRGPSCRILRLAVFRAGPRARGPLARGVGADFGINKFARGNEGSNRGRTGPTGHTNTGGEPGATATAGAGGVQPDRKRPVRTDSHVSAPLPRQAARRRWEEAAAVRLRGPLSARRAAPESARDPARPA